ncbi:MAG: SdrD B-like domain-containing protein [Candidatus Competibacter sp.]
MSYSNPTQGNVTITGWIDYDGDGAFGAASERATAVLSPGNGSANITFPVVPQNAVTSPYARFRISGQGVLPPDGSAPDGEVEDNRLNTGSAVNSLGAIGNYVWLDENSDGRQDPGERGIANVTVTLTGPVNRTTTTDANGGYLFAGLPAGTYQVQVSAGTLPAGLTQTTANPVGAGADFGNQTQPYAITLGSGETNLTADFGYNYNPETSVNGNTGNAALGDRVWIDADGDGRQDPGEPGVAGVTVNLFGDPDGNGVYDTPAGSTTTDASGNYIFTNLPPGAYVVVVDASTGPLAGYTQTGDPDHFGATGANDNRTTAPVVLGPGDVFLNADFGYQPPAAQNNSVGDTVWFDADADGAQDAGEPGIPGVTVALYRDSNGNGQLDAGEPAIATTTTDGNGNYLFAGVPDGNYIVRVTDTNNALGGLAQSGDPDRVLDGRGAVNLDNASANPAPVQNLDQDFGYTARGQQPGLGLIGDTIFLDGDGNGQPGPGEGIGGVTVRLYDATGTNLLATAVTDRNGHYSFGGLNPNGAYTVRVDTATLPPGVTNTVDPDGGVPNESVVTLTPASPINLNQDFGYRLPQGQTPGSIGNQIWLDRNADGVYAPNGPDGAAGTSDDEPGIAGVTVDLYLDANGNGRIDPGEPRIGTTTTDANGQYLFAGLPANNVNYVVQVSDRNGVLDGYAHSIGPNASDGATDDNSQAGPHPVRLTPGAPDYLLADFGYFVDGAAVGNRVWNDTNGNGIQDAGESGISRRAGHLDHRLSGRRDHDSGDLDRRQRVLQLRQPVAG